MRFAQAERMVRRRTGRRRRYHPNQLVRAIGFGRSGGGSGYDHDYTFREIERAVAYERMVITGGRVSGGDPALVLRRRAQDLIGEDHREGYVCISDAEAFFATEIPHERFAHGLGVFGVHQDCECR